MARIRKKCNPAHLAYDNIKNLPDRDSLCQYPDEPASVPGAGGHSPQEILGLQGIHSDLFLGDTRTSRYPQRSISRRYSDFKVSTAIYLYLTSARLVPINFKRKLPNRHPVEMILLRNPFLPVQCTNCSMGHASWVYYSNFDL